MIIDTENCGIKKRSHTDFHRIQSQYGTKDVLKHNNKSSMHIVEQTTNFSPNNSQANKKRKLI